MFSPLIHPAPHSPAWYSTQIVNIIYKGNEELYKQANRQFTVDNASSIDNLEYK